MRQYVESATVNGVYIRNGSTTGYASKMESGNIPASAPYVLELEEIIHDSAVLSGTVDGVTAELVPWTFAPAVGEIAVNRALGLIKFNSADAGLAVTFTYIPAGTIVSAGAMEEIMDVVAPTELDDLGDVNAPTPADGDVLTWDNTAGEWVAEAPAGGSVAAGDITAGTLDTDVIVQDASLSANVPLLNAVSNTFTGAMNVDGALNVEGNIDCATGTITADAFVGDGSGLTGISGSSPLTTKGDVYVFGTGNARLPVGTNGQVLTSDSAETLGVKWAAAGGGDVTAAGNNSFTGTNSFKNMNFDMDGSSSGSPRTIGFSNFGANEYWRAFDTVQGGWSARTQLWNFYGIKIKGNNQTSGIPAFETGNSSDPSLDVVGTQAVHPVLAVTGAASQSGNLQEWRNSGGTVLASVSSTGAFSGVPTLTGNNTMSGANTFSGANSFTATTNTFKDIALDMNGSSTASPRLISPANISSGEAWRVLENLQGGFGVQTQLYSYYGITIKGGNQIAVPSFVTGNNSDASLNVLGSDQSTATTLAVTAKTSQTGDLQEWRNSSGTMLAQVTVGGKFETTDEVELTTASKGVILKSPDGTRYRVTVANGGTLSVTAA